MMRILWILWRIFNRLTLNKEFIKFHEWDRNFFFIFARLKLWKMKEKSCLTSGINPIFNVKNIVFPVYYVFFDFFFQMHYITWRHMCYFHIVKITHFWYFHSLNKTSNEKITFISLNQWIKSDISRLKM